MADLGRPEGPGTQHESDSGDSIQHGNGFYFHDENRTRSLPHLHGFTNEVGEFVSADYSMTKRLGKAAAPMDTV